MDKKTTDTQEITLENWHFALAPLQEDEQRKIHIAIVGIQKLTDHLVVNSRIGEMDFVAGCFADMITEDLTRKTQIRKLFNHVLARGLRDMKQAK